MLTMNKPTVQDIFRHFYTAYLEKYSPSPEQAKTARNILNCKTGAYGANISVCEDCGAVQIHYNSCRNRCCPMCQAVPKEMWMDARREDVLDAPYFHLVFTVPDILNPVIYSNQKLLYDTLYHAASATIQELTSDPKHLGASVGYICILHTWGSEMNFHPHIHMILLGGGLTPKNEWKDNGTEFFLPIWAGKETVFLTDNGQQLVGCRTCCYAYFIVGIGHHAQGVQSEGSHQYDDFENIDFHPVKDLHQYGEEYKENGD